MKFLWQYNFFLFPENDKRNRSHPDQPVFIHFPSESRALNQLSTRGRQAWAGAPWCSVKRTHTCFTSVSDPKP